MTVHLFDEIGDLTGCNALLVKLYYGCFKLIRASLIPGNGLLLKLACTISGDLQIERSKSGLIGPAIESVAGVS